MELDSLIDLAISYGHTQGGRMRGENLIPLAIEPAKAGRPRSLRQPGWRPEEMRFLRENIARMTKEEIGAVLGRTPEAVKIACVRGGVPSASKQPGWLTGNQVARATGMDIHTVMLLHKLGNLPMEIIPGKRHILRMKKITLYRWATRWWNWLYFKPRRMSDGHLRRLVELAQARWTDAWWSVGDIARYHHADIRAVGARIQRGKVNAVRWGNWFMLRSDAIKMRFYNGKGTTCLIEWSPRADVFILHAKAEGKTIADIARMMKWNEKRVTYRWHILQKENRK